MYSTHLEFHRQGDDLPASVWLLLFWAKAQDNRTAVFLSVFLSHRPPPYAPSEIWSYRPAAVASACMQYMQCIQFDDRTSRFVCRLTDTVIGYKYAAFLHGGWKTESDSICRSSRRCWPWVWRHIPGKRLSLAASEGYTGGVTAQLATPEKSNPMYNAHPKL